MEEQFSRRTAVRRIIQIFGQIFTVALTLLTLSNLTEANAQTKSKLKLVLQVTVDGLRADLLNRYKNGFGKGGFCFIIPQANIAIGNATFGFDSGCFDNQKPRTRLGKIAKMNVMPVGGFAVIGRILTHRRNYDAVIKGKAAQCEGGEKGAHLSSLLW